LNEDSEFTPPDGGRKIVVVDDSDDNIALFQHLLPRMGYRDVEYFLDGREALVACQHGGLRPDLFLLDVLMPEIDGLGMAKKIKADEVMGEAAIVFITGRELDETLEECFEVGGADFVSKPISMIELRCRLMRVFEMQDLTRRLRIKNQELKMCTITDALTGVFNRRYLDQRLGEEVAKSLRYRHELSFLMLDLDHFKEVNDRLGHPVGDRVLRRCGEILKEMVRSTDLVARYGGEEFSIMLTGTPLKQAMETAERIRCRIEEECFLPELGDRDVTVSIGVATVLSGDLDAKALMESADEALYEVKKLGRNRVLSLAPDGGVS
jgi:diguanylate cyclase (GGDEF)-like protein